MSAKRLRLRNRIVLQTFSEGKRADNSSRWMSYELSQPISRQRFSAGRYVGIDASDESGSPGIKERVYVGIQDAEDLAVVARERPSTAVANQPAGTTTREAEAVDPVRIVETKYTRNR
jgi:hypothetical protein